MRKLIPILALGALSACTPSEEAAWYSWFDHDPDAAANWAVNEFSSSSSSSTSDEPDHAGESDTAGVYWPWTAIAECESGGNWSINTGNGYYGGLQFALGSWQAVGGSGLPSDASPSEQVYRAELLKDRQGYGAWPTCARVVGVL